VLSFLLNDLCVHCSVFHYSVIDANDDGAEYKIYFFPAASFDFKDFFIECFCFKLRIDFYKENRK